MSSFDDVAKLYQGSNNPWSILYEVVEDVLRNPLPLSEEKMASKEVSLKVPEFQIDSSWVSDEAEALNRSSFDRFMKVVKALSLPRDITQIGEFTSSMQSLLDSQRESFQESHDEWARARDRLIQQHQQELWW